ncbi:flagellar hook-length control protein FliK [Liquorilactobacillus ghanensis]|uniref:flagellar hook-length control protein FliK n=1 Tax=Liquorilactobacillus ghanensis TaxID=399370 RepID=UPI0039EB9D80
MNAQIEITTAIKAKTTGKKKKVTADQAKFNKALNKFHTSEQMTTADKLIKQFPKNNKSAVSSKQMTASKTTEQADVSDSMARDNSFITPAIKPADDKTMSATTVNRLTATESMNKVKKDDSIIANSVLALDSGLAIHPNLENKESFSESQVGKVNQQMIAKLEPLNSSVASATAIQSTKLNNSADDETNLSTMTAGETKKNSVTDQLQKNPVLTANIASIGAAKPVASGENPTPPTVMSGTSQTIAGQAPATDLSQVQSATTALVKAVNVAVAEKPTATSAPAMPNVNQTVTEQIPASALSQVQSATADLVKAVTAAVTGKTTTVATSPTGMSSTSQAIADQASVTDLSQVQSATTTLVKAVNAAIAEKPTTVTTPPTVSQAIADQAPTADLSQVQSATTALAKAVNVAVTEKPTATSAPAMPNVNQTVTEQIPVSALSQVQSATADLVKAVTAAVSEKTAVPTTPNTDPIVAAQASTADLPKVQTENQVKTTNVNVSGNDLMQSAIALHNAIQGGPELKSSAAGEKIENNQQLAAGLADKVSEQAVQVSDKNISSSNDLSDPQSALPDQVIAAPVPNQNIENSFKTGQTSLLDLMQPEHAVQTAASTEAAAPEGTAVKAPVASLDQKILFDSKVLQTAALNVAPTGKADFTNSVASFKQNLTWNTADTGGQAQLINNLTKEISTLTIPGSKTVTIKLSPENMGNVEITMKAAQSQVSLEVKVQTTAAKQLLGTVMDKLERVLQNQPYSADGNNAIKNATTVNQPNLSMANNTFFDFNGSQQQFTGRQSRHNFSTAAAKFADASPKQSAEVQQSDLRKSTISILA